MNHYCKKEAIIEAVQFDPEKQPWPPELIPWPDENGKRPRDMSFGYIDTPEGRKNVRISDWIITDGDGNKYVRDDVTFRRTYEAIA